MRIAVVGSVNTDLVIRVPALPSPGETVTGGDLETYPGGKGGNQAVAAGRLGAEVSLIARIGADTFGDQSIQALEENSVGMRGVVRDFASPSGIALIVVDQNGENTIAVAGGSNLRLSPSDVRSGWSDGISPVLAVLEVPVPAVQAAFEIARRRGATTILNAAPPMDLPDELLSATDYLIVNETEAAAISNHPVSNVEDAVRAAGLLAPRVRRATIITLGTDGAIYDADGSDGKVQGHPVAALDTTAAGDAFCWAFAVAITEGMVVEEAVRFANAAGAVTVMRPGAQPALPTRGEVVRMLGR